MGKKRKKEETIIIVDHGKRKQKGQRTIASLKGGRLGFKTYNFEYLKSKKKDEDEESSNYFELDL